MEKIAAIKRQAVEHLDRYFSGSETAEELRTWALMQPIFANPKELDNDDDWVVSNALALMIRLTEEGADRSLVEQGLHEARRFLTGEESFPEKYWPVGLSG